MAATLRLTIADTLLKETLPRFQATFVGREPQAGYGLNLLALLLTVVLFVMLSVLTKKRDYKRHAFHRRLEKATKMTSETTT